MFNLLKHRWSPFSLLTMLFKILQFKHPYQVHVLERLGEEPQDRARRDGRQPPAHHRRPRPDGSQDAGVGRGWTAAVLDRPVQGDDRVRQVGRLRPKRAAQRASLCALGPLYL